MAPRTLNLRSASPARLAPPIVGSRLTHTIRRVDPRTKDYARLLVDCIRPEPGWQVLVRGDPLPREQVGRLFRMPWPLPLGRDTHELSAAATAHAVRALLREEPTATHAPIDASLREPACL